MKFAIEFEDGTVKTIGAFSIYQAANENPEAVKISNLSKINLAKVKKGLNSDINGAGYLHPLEIEPFFTRALEQNGLPVNSRINEIAANDQGNIIIDCGGIFMNVSWFKMGSGKFEIVAYAN